MYGVLGKVMAWDRLHDPNIGGQMDAKGIYETAKKAGYTEDEAQKAMGLRAWERMNRDLPA